MGKNMSDQAVYLDENSNPRGVFVCHSTRAIYEERKSEPKCI